MTSISFPPNILSIGERCFEKNVKLSTIDIPNSVINIRSYAFFKSGLITINIQQNSNLTTLSSDCLSETKITSIFIPKNVSFISTQFIRRCPVERIVIDELNKKYTTDSKSIFSGSDNSTLLLVVHSYSGEYKVPSYVTSIDYYCFNGINLTSIKLHENIIQFSEGTFSGCNITSICIPRRVSRINKFCFTNCKNLEEITFSSDLLEIGVMAFVQCNKLKYLEFPDSLKIIEGLSFASCISLTYIIIPGSISTIGDYSFAGCKNFGKFSI